LLTYGVRHLPAGSGPEAEHPCVIAVREQAGDDQLRFPVRRRGRRDRHDPAVGLAQDVAVRVRLGGRVARAAEIDDGEARDAERSVQVTGSQNARDEEVDAATLIYAAREMDVSGLVDRQLIDVR